MYLQMVCRSGSFPDTKSSILPNTLIMIHLMIGRVRPGRRMDCTHQNCRESGSWGSERPYCTGSSSPGRVSNGKKNSICSPDGGIREGLCRGYRGWGSRGREQAVPEEILGIGVIKDSMKMSFGIVDPELPLTGGETTDEWVGLRDHPDPNQPQSEKLPGRIFMKNLTQESF